MKYIKLLFSISIAFICNKNLNAQFSYLDSSTYYTYCDAHSLTPGLSFASYSKELVLLDSANSMETFYKVLYESKDWNWNQRSYVYFLKVKRDTVFFSGTLYNAYDDSFEVNNLIIYNFNLNAGDTFKINHSASGLNIELLVDSVKNVKYHDNQIRRTQYYTVLSSGYNRVTLPFSASQGIGSNYGLIPFRIIRHNSPFWQELISVCNKDQMVVFAATESFNYLNIKNYCDEIEIIDLIDTIRSVSFDEISDQHTVLFPNPTNNILKVRGMSSGNALIYNSVGQLVVDVTFENQINISNLPQGIYQIILFKDNKEFRGKFIKNE